MNLLVAAAISITVAAGVYLLLSRDLFRVIVGLSVLGAAVNLVVFAAGRLVSVIPPLLSATVDAGEAAKANPLVQALVLTAIVISFALMCFALVLGARLRTSTETTDTASLRAAEPPPEDSSPKPPELPY